MGWPLNTTLKRSLLPCVVAVVVSTQALGQSDCGAPVQTSFLGGFWFAGNPSDGQQQQTDIAWQYRRGSSLGPRLAGVVQPQWYASGCWGTPANSSLRPSVGPIANTNQLFSQLLKYDRPPSFNGLVVRPDAGSDVFAAFAPSTAVQISDISGACEMLDQASEGLIVQMTIETASGARSLVSPVLVGYTQTGSTTLKPVPGMLPLTLSPGDRLVIRAGLAGNPHEDWGNLNASISFTGGPVLLLTPRSVYTTECDQVGLQVVAVGSGSLSYSWEHESLDTPDEFDTLFNGPSPGGSIVTGAASPNLQIIGPTNPDRGAYRCQVSGPCTTVTAGPVSVDLCPVDFNCDGFLDFFDFVGYVSCFEGDCPPGRTADFDGDGFADFYDLSDFATAFQAGCPDAP